MALPSTRSLRWARVRPIHNFTFTQRRHFHHMKAVVIGDNGARVDLERKIPIPREDQILVRPVAVALNPTDWRHVVYQRAREGCILGCDYAGIVEVVGSAVTKNWKPGDRIYGCGHGANLMNPDDGVFAEVAAVVGDLQMRIPESMSFEQAATLGLGTITVGQGLFQKALKLELPKIGAPNNHNADTPVLIYGGSTATGALGIQYAKLAGYKVITTCSSKQAEYVTSLGADHWVDYRDENAGAQIRRYTDNSLTLAWDTISTPASVEICTAALTDDPSKSPVLGTLLPVKSARNGVNVVVTVMYTAFGREFQFGPTHMPADHEDFSFAKTFYSLTEQLVEHGHLKPHRHRLCPNGLNGIIDGLRELQNGQVKGEKLVYRVAD